MEQNNNQQRIEFLIQQFQQGTLTPVQHQELLGLLAQSENTELANWFLDQVWAQQHARQDFFSTAQTERIHGALMADIEKPKPKRGLFSARLVRITAAAAVLVLMVSYLLYNYYSETQISLAKLSNVPNQPFIADALPGGNKATLKLDNDQVIVLDTLKNGVHIDLGNLTLHKTAAGKVVFEVNTKAERGRTTAYHTISTPIGGEYEVVLADGSKVWLNAASSLKFPTTFIEKERKVELVGEGYFDVAKLNGKPFIVSSKDLKVEVLGTQFNINAYPDEQGSKTTLVEGSVKISNKTKAKILVPDEQAVIKNGQLSVESVDVQDAIAWKEGYFVFDNEEIQSVMRKLSRWYKVQVEYENVDVNDQFVGKISKFKNITEILKLLQATGTVNFKVLPSQDPQFERRVLVMK